MTTTTNDKKITVERACELAIEKGHRVLYHGRNFADGRVYFRVTSATDGEAPHTVKHTENGLVCGARCRGFKHSQTCAHTGCVILKLRALCQEERNMLLTPAIPERSGTSALTHAEDVLEDVERRVGESTLYAVRTVDIVDGGNWQAVTMGRWGR